MAADPTLEKPAGVDLSNWRMAPYSRWAFQHLRQLVPTAAIAAGDQPWILPAKSAGLDAAEIVLGDGEKLEQYLDESFSDSLLVLHRGKTIYRWSAPHCDLGQPQLLFSVSKSITAILAGILQQQNLLDVSKTVLHYLPGCKASAFEKATVQQALDMTVAIEFSEDYLNPDGDYRRYRDATCWNPVDQTRPGPHLESFLYSLGKAAHAHGEVFAYRSPISDLLGLLVERVAGVSYAEFMSSELWQPMGAQTDAYVTVDRAQLARGAGGICATIDDLAKIGQLILNRGEHDGRQVIPQSWIEDTWSRGDRAAWDRGSFAGTMPVTRYRNQWYVAGERDQPAMAIGIHGQYLYVDPATELVIAKLSSQPEPLDDALDQQAYALFAAIRKHLTE